MARARSLSPVAYLLLGATTFLVLGGLLMVYSASSVADYVKYGDSAYHLKKQAMFALLGVVALFATSHWDFRPARTGIAALLTPRNCAWGLWGVSLVGLLVVDFMGVAAGGATRSIDLGIGYVQPSEYAKLGALLVAATLLVEWRRKKRTAESLALWLAIAILPVAALIMLQPDMGTTMTLIIGVFLVLLLGGVSGRLLGGAVAIGVPAVGVLIALESYRAERFLAFVNPWADPSGGGYQIIQSLYAFGSGGWFGVGLGLSRQKFFYLPAAHTDFIFAVIGEELGLAGTLSVVVAFALFAYAGIKIALDSRDLFGKLLAGGLTAMIGTQAVINMAAVTGLMPITGIPLPLVSAGGSSLTLTLACVGLILAVARTGGGARVRLVEPNRRRESDRANSSEWRRDGRPHLSGDNGRRAADRRGA